MCIINFYGFIEVICFIIWVEIDVGLCVVVFNLFLIGVVKLYVEVFLDDGEICMVGDYVMWGYFD